MAIEYVEIRNQNTDIIGIIDAANSIIWHSVFFGVGDFEIYTEATPEALKMLQKFNYVTRPDDIEIGIIEKIEIVNDENSGLMISAAGRFAKSILDRRLIYNLSGKSNTPTVLRGNVEENIRTVVYDNAIFCDFDSKRNISILELGEFAGITARIVDNNGYATQKQTSYANLLDYTDSVLQEYGLASIVVLNAERRKLQYIVYAGIDRSIDNVSGNQPVIFSQEFDNLTASAYMCDTTAEKNAALIGGEGEGVARFYSLLAGSETDLQRREIFIDASSINKTYKEESGESEEEKTYTDEEYKALLDAKGKQDLAPLVMTESYEGTIDIENGNYVYNRDFYLGDIVTVQDNQLEAVLNVRITEITEVQDENGYTVDAIYST